MKQSRSYWLTIAGFVLALPAAIFICFSLLKFNWSVDGPYDAISPLLEDTGISEPPGWNVNLLILLGPIVGFLCVLSQLLKIDWKNNKDVFQFNILIMKKWFAILVAVFSVGIISFLFLYAVGENCNCSESEHLYLTPGYLENFLLLRLK